MPVFFLVFLADFSQLEVTVYSDLILNYEQSMQWCDACRLFTIFFFNCFHNFLCQIIYSDFFSYSSCYTWDSLLTFLISFSSWHTYYFLTIHLRVHIFKIFCQFSLLLQLPSVLFNFALHKKCPYSELFWSLFSRIRTEYAEIRSISPCSVRMRENMD